jgi:hypothetical protein
VTDIEICSMALGFVKTGGINSFEEETDEARACKTFYGPARDKVLEDRIWSFAKRQYVFDAALAEEPLFFFTKQWELPAEIIRVHRVTSDSDDPTGQRLEWDLQGRRILTGDVDKLYVTAVRREEDASLYSPGFCTAVALRLAYIFAIPLAENRQLKADLWEEYQREIKDAGGADGAQGKSERTRSTRYRDVR